MLIAQLSDPHLGPEGALYKDVADSNAMFAAAIATLNALRPRPDLAILSGDVVEDGTPAEYAVARRCLARLEMPLLVIPGNHDDRAAFRAAFSDHAYLPRTGPLHFCVGTSGAVQVVGLDVTVPGHHHGLMDADAARWLDATLAAEPDRPTLIMMHQPPFESGIPYIDAYLCREGERLAAVVRTYPAVARIVCGHVHRFMQVTFGGTMLCTAPSTTTAIALRLASEATPASFVEPPAVLLHHWRPQVGLVTHHLPVGDFPGPYPFF